MRQFNIEDILFEDFMKTGDEEALVKLIESTNGVLFGIVFGFVDDNETAENILDDVFDEFIRKKHKCDTSKFGVLYFLYLLAKEKMFRYVK